MSLTLLIDLDDTLLNNDIDQFLPFYLKALSKHLSAHVPGDVMVRELLAATGQMIKNTNPCLTLETAFDHAFYPALGLTKNDLHKEIEIFYDEIFPGLQSLTSPRPEAVALVEDAFARGYQVVVATNPLFPQKAIHHRLAWAGLPVDRYPFALVTSYECLHFAKPNPAYYGEILAQLGWPNQPAVMVGNSLSDDILPAASLGMPTFWLSGTEDTKQDANPLSARGSLAEVPEWLRRVETAGIQAVPTNPEAVLAVLRSTPAALQTITSQMEHPYWIAQPGGKEWSITQILCHLRDTEHEVNLPRMKKVIQEENSFLPGINTDLWAIERKYEQQSGLSALDQFSGWRIQLLNLLQKLTAEEWNRMARHAIFGPTRLVELVSFMATHDRAHLTQCWNNIHA